MTAVVVDSQRGKEYRLPTAAELEAAEVSEEALAKLYADVPYGCRTSRRRRRRWRGRRARNHRFRQQDPPETLAPPHRQGPRRTRQRRQPATLVDCLHRTMRLWKTGEQSRVDGYLEAQCLWRNDLFKQVCRRCWNLRSRARTSVLRFEYVQNHLAGDDGAVVARQRGLLEG